MLQPSQGYCKSAVRQGVILFIYRLTAFFGDGISADCDARVVEIRCLNAHLGDNI